MKYIDNEGNLISLTVKGVKGDPGKDASLTLEQQTNLAKIPEKYDDVALSGNELNFKANGVVKKTIIIPSGSGGSSLALGNTSATAYRGDYGELAYNHSQVDHAPSNAEANVQVDWNVTDMASNAYIKNKPTIISINDTTASTSSVYSSSKTDILLGNKAQTSHSHVKTEITDFPTFATVATSGSYNDLSNKPTIPAAYTLPTASASVLGGIKVGSGLSISNGVLSTSLLNDATPSTTSAYSSSKVDTLFSGVSTSYEPIINSKGTAFNKNFGTASGTVSEGNHVHSGYANSTHSHATSDITNLVIPTSLPANGGNADTVDNYHIWVGTLANYNAISSKSASTIYIITG